MTNSMVIDGKEEFLQALKEIQAQLASLITDCAVLDEKIEFMNNRITRAEDGVSKLIEELKPEYKTSACPYKSEIFSINREIFGDDHMSGIINEIDTLQEKMSFYKGAIWVLGGIITLASILIPLLIKLL